MAFGVSNRLFARPRVPHALGDNFSSLRRPSDSSAPPLRSPSLTPGPARPRPPAAVTWGQNRPARRLGLAALFSAVSRSGRGGLWGTRALLRPRRAQSQTARGSGDLGSETTRNTTMCPRTVRALGGARPPFPACSPQRPPSEPTARQAPCERVHTARSARVRGVSAVGWAGCDGRLAEVTGGDGRTGLRPRSPRSFSEEPRWAAPSARPHRRPPAPAGASRALPLHWGHFSSLDFLLP